MDPVTCETSKKKIEFKHVKVCVTVVCCISDIDICWCDQVHRRNDVERRRRKKRIEWMKKL